MNLRPKNVLLVGVLIALVSGGAVAAIITVNSTLDIAKNDDGKCTLREAITAASTITASGAAGNGKTVTGSLTNNRVRVPSAESA